MSARKSSEKRIILYIGAVAGGIAVALFAYLMWYVSPDHVLERVKVIAVTEDGCIAETLDGHPMNIGPCDAEPGEYIDAFIDQKIKERALLMNPTT